MMCKGAIVKRGSRTVRQFAVMVGTNIQLVTSGDVVDAAIYQALAAAGAIVEPNYNGDIPEED